MRHVIPLSILLAAASSITHAAEPGTLPGTEPLTIEGDIAAQMVAGVDKFLLRKTEETAKQREEQWSQYFKAPEHHPEFLATKRRRLAEILGVRLPDGRAAPYNWLGTTTKTALTDNLNGCSVSFVQISMLPTPYSSTDAITVASARALLISSRSSRSTNRVVFIPGEDATPYDLLESERTLGKHLRIPYVLARQGYFVIVPLIVTRHEMNRGDRIKLSHREFVYRSSFELGRHPIGYDVQIALTCGAWLKSTFGCRQPTVSYYGFGEGGKVAMLAGALEQAPRNVCISQYFDERNQLWQEPIDRNVFGLLAEFGDAEIASMLGPRKLIVDASDGITYAFANKAHGYRRRVEAASRRREFERLLRLTENGEREPNAHFFEDSQQALAEFLDFDDVASLNETDAKAKEEFDANAGSVRSSSQVVHHVSEIGVRHQVGELIEYNEMLLAESPYVRMERFWNKLDYSSVEAFEKSVARFREEFKHEVIGHFDDKPLPFNPRTRKAYDEEKWVGYEVMLDLWPDVFCYGILCLPKDMKRDGSEKRPVVVCQHGLEGRPQDIVAGDHRAYHDFASKLCERGFITFAPQNLYIGGDKFRTLQRKANPLGKTLFSIITPQHQQIVNWLKTQPYVDGERIGFYGLSYGGKTAMRVPPLVDDYKCVICSADFNDWVWKNASTRAPYSYVWTGEYEIFEWNLAHTFNYAEMAALIAPRPFMVERGHYDGVAPDERVAYEFAKVRHLYAARLKLPADYCQIEWFDGPHTINGKGTFAFLHQHLDWPAPDAKDEGREAKGE